MNTDDPLTIAALHAAIDKAAAVCGDCDHEEVREAMTGRLVRIVVTSRCADHRLTR